jgi:hypothetical protein
MIIIKSPSSFDLMWFGVAVQAVVGPLRAERDSCAAAAAASDL